MGIPEGKVTIKSLGIRGKLFDGEVISIKLLGSAEKIKFEQNPMEFRIQIPVDFQGKYGSVFNIERAS